MTGQIIALHPIEIEFDASQASEEFSRYTIAPVIAIAESASASIKAGALPLFRKAKVTVRLSESLIVALQAEGAFDLIVEYDQ